MLKKFLLACLELKIGQEAETNFQSGQFPFADPSDFGKSRVRIAEILQGFHGHS